MAQFFYSEMSSIFFSISVIFLSDAAHISASELMFFDSSLIVAEKIELMNQSKYHVLPLLFLTSFCIDFICGVILLIKSAFLFPFIIEL